MCKCDPTYVAENSPACAYECPHKPTVEEPCSGFGTCKMNDEGTDVYCDCNRGPKIEDNWYGRRCDCNEIYTCFGHGSCNDFTGECNCFQGRRQEDRGPSFLVDFYTYIDDDYVPDTYNFNSPAHYMMPHETQPVDYFFEGMIVNILGPEGGVPVEIKTVVKDTIEGKHVQIVELTELEAKILKNTFDLKPIANDNALMDLNPLKA